MIVRHAPRLRWLEPIGQIVVLVALGFQIFLANPAIQASSQASLAYIQALLEQHTLPEHPERGQSGIARDRSALALLDAQQTAQVHKADADFEKTWPSALYAGLFVLGSIMVIIGKLSSVAYSTKAPIADTDSFDP